MEISLPKKISGARRDTITGDVRHFVIIGANGAGKTRFTTNIKESLGERAWSLSALDGLYQSASRPDKEPQPGSPGSLEQLLARLMHDEMVNLIGYKLALADGRKAEIRRTRLDKVIEIWQEVFPDNRMLIESGKILFSRGIDEQTYTSLRLSDGERTVLYYAASVLYAPRNSAVFVDSPELFLHPTLTVSLWNRLEILRRDCTFCYTTHDPEFASSRNGAPVIWVRDCDPASDAWDYDILPAGTGVSNEVYMSLVGARKPLLFIEGDGQRSLDAKIYPLIFPDFMVRSLGSCNKVIEATRTFNDLAGLHKMDSFGIVDRDRRDDVEVGYLRRKKVMVPEVAEIENILLLEDVVRAMATFRGKDPERVFSKVKHTILSLFRAELRQQALQHTRHRVKREMEYKVDARFQDISKLEQHLSELLDNISPRRIYEDFCRRFRGYLEEENYAKVLQVFNWKPMVNSSNVAPLCGYNNRDEYVAGLISLLSGTRPEAATVRHAVKTCLGIED